MNTNCMHSFHQPSSYMFQDQIRVWLEFPAMSAPVEVSVPWSVLFYLDTHSDRRVMPDGNVLYRQCHEAPLESATALVHR